jgi:hypothetical protein
VIQGDDFLADAELIHTDVVEHAPLVI